MKKQSFLKIVFFVLGIASIPKEVFGFSYEYFTDGHSTSVHVLVVNPKDHQILPVKADGGVEAVKELASQYGVVAAINGGFYNLDGTSSGILKIDNHWYGLPSKPRGAIGWSESGKKAIIDRVLTSNEEDIEVIPFSTDPDNWKSKEHIVGGTPFLIQQGKLIEDYSLEQTRESFLINKYPRTAVGIRENGEWVFVVVDDFYKTGGMTIRELAELMQQLECVEALNLCGGSSSTMVIEDAVVNETCGNIQEGERQGKLVSDAILVLPRLN